MRTSFAVVALVFVTACGGPTETDAGPLPDAAGLDSGGQDAAPFDAGPRRDAGPQPDGAVDAGADVDAFIPVQDECALGLDDCLDSAICVDDERGFHCECEPPLVGDGLSCGDAFRGTIVRFGQEHACHLEAGTVRCFGGNAVGALGSGVGGDLPGFAHTVALPSDAVDVAAGGRGSCAVLDSGQLWCWGFGLNLGLGDAGPNPPTRVGDGSDWTHVRMNQSFGCGLRAGALYCWGQSLPEFPNLVVEPRAIDGATGFASLRSARCGFLTNGQSGCWSDGAFEELVPTETFVAMSDTGGCVIDAAGALWCRADLGELNTGETLGSYRRVTARSDFVDVAGSCAVDRGGRLQCFGGIAPRNRSADFRDVVPMPEAIVGVTGGGEVRPTRCALGVSGQRYCWGWNGHGELGFGTRGVHPEPQRIGTELWTAVSGHFFSTCGTRASDGALYCWGEVLTHDLAELRATHDEPRRYEDGPWALMAGDSATRLMIDPAGALFAQGGSPLGLGDEVATAAEPMQVGAETGWTAVDVETNDRACGIRSGELLCWTGRDAPAPVSLETDWVDVSVREDDWCAVRAGGELLCNGVRVGESLDFQQVATHPDASCGVADGRAYCWGRQLRGERVPGGPDDLEEPTLVNDETDWSFLALSNIGTCGIRAGGELYCWGIDFQALVGGTSPQGIYRVGDASDWVFVTMRRSHICGLRTGGELYCWGDADNGAVGNGEVWYDVPGPVVSP